MFLAGDFGMRNKRLFLCLLILLLFVSGFVPSAAFAQEEIHEHSYGDWEHDSLSHWKSCECGHKTDIEKHQMVWEETDSRLVELFGLQKGVCRVCGYEMESELERLLPLLKDTRFLLLFLFFLFLALLIIGIVTVNLSHNLKRVIRHLRHRRHRHHHHHHHHHHSENPADQSKEKPTGSEENDGAAS